MSKLKQIYDEQDATAVALPEYREPELRPYRAGDYTSPSPEAELRQPDRPPSMEFQLMTADENYERGHDFFKEQFDRTGITDAAAESRDFYENELAYSNPVLAAVGSTLAGEAFDFWREAATDPINVATAGMGAAPKAVLGSGVRSGTLHRVAKLAEAVDNRQMGGFAAHPDVIKGEYVKALRGLRSRQRELFKEAGRELPSFEASEPLHLSAITEALEGGLGRPYDTRAIVAFPTVGLSGSTTRNGEFETAFGYQRDHGGIIRPGLDQHALLDPQGVVYGGKPAKVIGGQKLGLGPDEKSGWYRSPFNLDPGQPRGLVRPPDAAWDLAKATEKEPREPLEMWRALQSQLDGRGSSFGPYRQRGALESLAKRALKEPTADEAAQWALMQDRLQAGSPAYDAGRVGGIGGARKWDSGAPWVIDESSFVKEAPYEQAWQAELNRANEARGAYTGPSLIKMYKK